MSVHGFFSKLSESHRIDARDMIGAFVPYAVDIEKIMRPGNDGGMDYEVFMPSGESLSVDHKHRECGVSRNWRNGQPELTLEIWSVIPEEGRAGKVGWTRDFNKNTDYVLFTFHPADAVPMFFIPFVPLREMFERWWQRWQHKYPTLPSSSFERGVFWRTLCMYVPWFTVEYWVSREMGQDARGFRQELIA